MIELIKVTRVEVIENAKRKYVKWDCKKVKASLQDDNRTLKIFLEGYD